MRFADIQSCKACGDPLDEHGECRRCNWGSWGGWNTDNPTDPTKDLKSPVQSKWHLGAAPLGRVIPQDRWNWPFID